MPTPRHSSRKARYFRRAVGSLYVLQAPAAPHQQRYPPQRRTDGKSPRTPLCFHHSPPINTAGHEPHAPINRQGGVPVLVESEPTDFYIPARPQASFTIRSCSPLITVNFGYFIGGAVTGLEGVSAISRGRDNALTPRRFFVNRTELFHRSSEGK